MSENVTINDGTKKHLLIIEDSVDYRTLLKRLFSREGYEVSCANHGLEALQLLHGSSALPNVILLDLMMPVMDGFEFRAKQLEEPHFSAIPVILMTAHGNLETDPIKLGIRDCVRKPVEMAQLLAIVNSVVSH